MMLHVCIDTQSLAQFINLEQHPIYSVKNRSKFEQSPESPILDKNFSNMIYNSFVMILKTLVSHTYYHICVS